MKENEAPEKIYLQPRTIEQLPHQNIVYTKSLADNSIEYIRTDAFIEKACEWLKGNAYLYVNDYTGSLNEDLLIDEFKNYMEGK